MFVNFVTSNSKKVLKFKIQVKNETQSHITNTFILITVQSWPNTIPKPGRCDVWIICDVKFSKNWCKMKKIKDFDYIMNHEYD